MFWLQRSAVAFFLSTRVRKKTLTSMLSSHVCRLVTASCPRARFQITTYKALSVKKHWFTVDMLAGPPMSQTLNVTESFCKRHYKVQINKDNKTLAHRNKSTDFGGLSCFFLINAADWWILRFAHVFASVGVVQLPRGGGNAAFCGGEGSGLACL